MKESKKKKKSHQKIYTVENTGFKLKENDSRWKFGLSVRSKEQQKC